MANNQANIKAVITAEDKSKSVLTGFSNNVSSIGSQIASTMKVAAVAMGVATTAAVGFAVKSAANFEQTRIGLENMLGSADKARGVLAEVSKFAAETPFEFPELAQATRQLIAFGFTGEEAISTMKQLGDVSAAVGTPINDLAYLMGTLKTQGRAFTIDIRQFAQRGIPIYEYLAKVLNTNTEALTGMIEAGKVGFPEVQKAFQAMTAEGGKFNGTMAKQSKSLNGLFSTLKDTIGQTARELIGITAEGDIKEGSVFARLRDATSWLIDNLPMLIEQMKEIVQDIMPQLRQWGESFAEVARQVGEYLWPKLETLWKTVQDDLIPVLTRLWKEVIVPLAPVVGTVFVAAIGLAIDALNLFITVLSPIIDFMLNNKESVLVFAGTFGVLATALGFGPVAAAFVGSMNTIKGAYVATQAIVATPMVMPAIAIAAALTAIAKVASEYLELQRIIDKNNQTLDKWKSMTEERNRTVERIRAQYGDEAALRYVKMQVPARALGGAVTAGRAYQVGERGAEMFVPNQNGRIVNDQDLKGMGSNTTVENNTTINMSFNIGMYAGTEHEKRRVAEEIMKAFKDLASMRGTSVEKILGGNA